MRTIWKYPIARKGYTAIRAERDDPIVLAAIDHQTRDPAIWIMHERPESHGPGLTAAEEMDHLRYFRVALTGDDIEPGERHVGSMTQHEFVWHIFERAD